MIPATMSADTAIEVYRTMVLIRELELRIESEYHLDEMHTPVHLCIGQEAVAAGVCAQLRTEDYLSSNHRGHGHYLAKGGDLNALVAELHNRETGCSKGRGGSMHLVDVSVGHTGSSSIVGGGIPIGTGLALASKMQRQDRVSAVFFGDGAADEGVLYESLNFALLKTLPVVYVYENNQYSVCSRVQARQKTDNVYHYLPRELLLSEKVDGNDAGAVYEAAGRAVAHARQGAGPAFLECVTYRIRGHHGPGPDTGLGYRGAEEVAEWEARCPLERFKKDLFDAGLLDEDAERRIYALAGKALDEAFTFAKSSPLPAPEDVTQHLFRE